MAKPISDQDLLMALRKGRSDAFSELYRRYFRMVQYLVTHNSGHQEDASDLFQDALIILVQKARDPQFSLSSSIKTYLYSICRNLWLKRLRDKGKMKIVDFEKPIEVAMPEEEEDLSERQTALLHACLEKLGDSCRKILERYYFFRMNMQEIAEELDYTNAANVKNQKYKCIQRLKKMALEQMSGA